MTDFRTKNTRRIEKSNKPSFNASHHCIAKQTRALFAIFVSICLSLFMLGCVFSQRGYDSIIDTSPFAILRYEVQNATNDEKTDKEGNIIYSHQQCEIVFEEVPDTNAFQRAIDEYKWIVNADGSISYAIERDTWNETFTLPAHSKIATYEYEFHTEKK